MENEILEHKRHTLSHILASVLLEKYPDIKITLGPAIDNGFYYDVDFASEKPSTEKDYTDITEAMREKIKSGGTFSHKEVTKDEALEYFANNEYKIELINEIAEKGEKITLYTINYNDGKTFTDLCRGGHADDIKEIDIDSFKVTHTAGAYWRGNEKNKMLTRVYGLAFNNKSELEEYEIRIEEAKKRDHRKLGKELELFIFSDLVGTGMPLFTPKGNIIREEIVNFSRELNKELGFGEVHTPNINKAELFKISGHYDKYKEDMLTVKSQYVSDEMFLKPMNCPQHTQLFASQLRSYRDLPIRYSDFAVLYRDERPGEMSGLTRLRSFAQDDGHIFCREDQIEEEIANVLVAIEKALKTYKVEYWMRLSLRDENKKEKYLGEDEVWEKSQAIMTKLLQEKNIKHKAVEGEAAFYGPKIDIMAIDAIGREWQISTIQLDFNMPKRFQLEYTDKDGLKKNPVMIHRALIGSPDRFLGILLEHYAGNFPLWMSPVQLSIIPVNIEAHSEYAKNIFNKLKENNFRVELEDSKDGLGKKVRYAKDMKYPYWIVIGNKEVEENTVTLESRSGEKFNLSLEELIEKLKEEVNNKK